MQNHMLKNKSTLMASIAVLGVFMVVTACGGGGTPASSSSATTTTASAETEKLQEAKVLMGEKLFNELTISSSGNLACASCHAKDRGHADLEGVFLPLGGKMLTSQGLRSSPSLEYLNANLGFRFDALGQPTGGFTWDGRADTRQQQAHAPLFDAKEMANESEASLVSKLKALSYYNEFAELFGVAPASSDSAIITLLTQALEVYQSGDADYERFSSKFDAVQAGTAVFTAQEARGLAIFNDPRRGNCASCHSSTPDPTTGKVLFTNFSYHALGLPRNTSSATLDASFFDLGLCGPNRTDLSQRNDLCGKFKTPTLRNIALTAPYFHNGVIATLEDAVDFYVTRDTQPARWYPSVNGQVQQFNDLPAQYHGNVNRQAPFGSPVNGRPHITAQEAADLVRFMHTLTDGYTP
jgi:cytochrome c peroxidase